MVKASSRWPWLDGSSRVPEQGMSATLLLDLALIGVPELLLIHYILFGPLPNLSVPESH